MKIMKWFYTFLIIVLVFSCTKVEIEPLLFFDLMEIPEGFPNIVEPDDNHFSKKRWALGKKLFFDPIMSSDSTVSCASCHAPNLAFSDKVALSLGVKDRIGTQNAPTLVNLAYHPYYTSAGGVPTLEMQTLVPIQEHNEFDFNILYIVERLKNNSTYVQMSNDAYSKTPDAFVITRSLANFERFRVIAGVTASEAGHLRVGSPAWVSFNDLGNTMLKGTIQSIGHIADTQSGTYPLEVWIERGNETAIREGMIASIMVHHQSEQETLAIPAAALFRQAGQAYVYRIVDNKAQLTAIRAGRTVAGSLEITAGLMVGDTVVVDGMFALRDGVAINITHTVPQPATSSSTHTARTPH